MILGKLSKSIPKLEMDVILFKEAQKLPLKMPLKDKIVVRMLPIWNGGASMYDSDSGKIELRISLKNNSNKEIEIKHVYLRIRKKGIKFMLFEEMLIDVVLQ